MKCMKCMKCIVGFVALANKETWVRFAREAAAWFREHGAKRGVDCRGDDVPSGKITLFPLDPAFACR